MKRNRKSSMVPDPHRVRTWLTLAMAAGLLAIAVTPSICRADFILSRPDVPAAHLSVHTQAEFDFDGTTRREHPFMFGNFADSLTQTSADSGATADATSAIATDIDLDPDTGVVTIVVAGQENGRISGAENARTTANSQFSFSYQTTSQYTYEITGDLSLAGDGSYSFSLTHAGRYLAAAENFGNGNDIRSDSINASGVIGPGDFYFFAEARIHMGGVGLDSGTLYSSEANFGLTFVLTPMDTFRWTNPAGDFWSEGSNWEPGQAPGASDTAIFDLSGAYTVSLDADTTVEETRVLAGSVTLEFGENELVSGDVIVDGVGASLTFDGGGGIVVSAAVLPEDASTPILANSSHGPVATVQNFIVREGEWKSINRQRVAVDDMIYINSGDDASNTGSRIGLQSVVSAVRLVVGDNDTGRLVMDESSQLTIVEDAILGDDLLPWGRGSFICSTRQASTSMDGCSSATPVMERLTSAKAASFLSMES